MASCMKACSSSLEKSGKLSQIQVEASGIRSIKWNYDGRRLASGNGDGTISILVFDGSKFVKDHLFKGHNGRVEQLCWHPCNPDILASAGLDKTVRFWDSQSKRCIETVLTEGQNIYMCWSSNGLTIAVENKMNLVTFIDARSYKILKNYQFQVEINEMAWNKENDCLFVTNWQGSILILSYPELEIKRELKGHPANCICIDFDRSGQHFATGGADSLVCLWDTEYLACLRVFSRLDWPVHAISFNHDGKWIAAASEDKFIDIADVETGKQVAAIPSEAPVFLIAWHPKYNLLAYSCDIQKGQENKKGTIKLFNV